jgi:hypothetical protein
VEEALSFGRLEVILHEAAYQAVIEVCLWSRGPFRQLRQRRTKTLVDDSQDLFGLGTGTGVRKWHSSFRL